MPVRAAKRIVLLLAILGATACDSLSFGCKVERLDANVVMPDSFVVAFETSRGRFDVTARTQWSPIGVWRFQQLVNAKYFDGTRFFRVLKNIAQFGLSGDPAVNAAWRRRCIPDEPVKHANARGTISYARGGEHSRSVQLFINRTDNPLLDASDGFGFPPIGEVTSGMSVVDSLYSGYGESMAKSGPQYGAEGPRQDSIMAQGNAYLERGFPKLDFIKTARVVRQWPAPPNPAAGR